MWYHCMNVTEMKMGIVAAKMPTIHPHFGLIDIISPNDFPSGLLKPHSHKTDSSKELSNRSWVFHFSQPISATLL